MKQDFYKPEVKQWKEENPQLWKALQLLWLGLVIGNLNHIKYEAMLSIRFSEGLVRGQ
jgi:hypothetical protein